MEGILDDGSVGDGIGKRESDFDGGHSEGIEAANQVNGDAEVRIAGRQIGQ